MVNRCHANAVMVTKCVLKVFCLNLWFFRIVKVRNNCNNSCFLLKFQFFVAKYALDKKLAVKNNLTCL